MENKKRRPLVAGVLSLIQPGLGQMYNGQILKAILFYIGTFLLMYGATLINIHQEYYLLYILLGYRVVVMIEAIIHSIRVKEIILLGYNKWYYYLLFIIVATLLTIPIYTFFKQNVLGLQPYFVPSGSMEPTIEANERVMVDTKFTRPVRGDVMVIRYPMDPNRLFIKRVVGIEGDTIEARNSVVYINGLAVKEPYVSSKTHDFGPLTIPSNEIFVMGDNRSSSEDSRMFGPIKSGYMKGKVLYIYMSNNKKRVGKKVN